MEVFNRGDKVLVQQTRRKEDKFSGRILDFNPRTRNYLIAIDDMPAEFVTTHEENVKKG